MDDTEKNLLKHQKQYLHLQYQITQHLLAGKNPPKELVEKARETGLLAEIPNELIV